MPESHRIHSLDLARGVLLVAMVAIHVLSAHGTAEEASFLHQWVGVFLISTSFVALSGYVIGTRGGGAAADEWSRGIQGGLHLVLVMVGYAVLLSLLGFGLKAAAGGAAACETRFGWAPPTRFAALGILLPIAIVQVLAPLARLPALAGVPVTGALAFAWMALPAATAGISAEGPLGAVVGTLARRTLTPYYTIAYFVALGLMGALAGRFGWGVRGLAPRAWRPWVYFTVAVVLAMPPVSRNLLDPAFAAGGAAGGAAAMLAYWSVAILAFLRGCASFPGGGGRAGAALALLGRHSLLVFVAHDALLLLDTFFLTVAGGSKGLAAVALMVVSNVALLWLLCRAVEARPLARQMVGALLLERSRGAFAPEGPRFLLYGVAALIALASVYTSARLAHSGAEQVVDDFESSDECPRWWTFGSLTYARVPADASATGHGRRVLAVRGHDPDRGAHGRGLFHLREIGSRRTLKLDVRGYGPSSGRLTIELYDDDNGNWEIEKDSSYRPLHDDRFVHSLDVDWTGWRQIAIPVSLFRDDNPGVGNDVFDPERDLTSGGLLQIQLLFAAQPGGHGDVRLDLDNLRWAP
jgi:hypothetical protein